MNRVDVSMILVATGACAPLPSAAYLGQALAAAGATHIQGSIDRLSGRGAIVFSIGEDKARHLVSDLRATGGSISPGVYVAELHIAGEDDAPIAVAIHGGTLAASDIDLMLGLARANDVSLCDLSISAGQLCDLNSANVMSAGVDRAKGLAFVSALRRAKFGGTIWTVPESWIRVPISALCVARFEGDEPAALTQILDQATAQGAPVSVVCCHSVGDNAFEVCFRIRGVTPEVAQATLEALRASPCVTKAVLVSTE